MKATLTNAFDTYQERIWYFLRLPLGPRIPVKKRLRINAQGNESCKLDSTKALKKGLGYAY